MEGSVRTDVLAALAAALTLAACGQEGSARQQIRIVGSSTVYPFTTAVAERFAQAYSDYKAPIVESTGTGAGMKLFCSGVGAQFPDISNASRRIKQSELEDCAKNGVNQVIELQVGIDGLALIEAADQPPFRLTLEDVYKAVSANPYGRANQALTWRDVNPALPAVAIKVYGPPPTSGTRDSFAEMILEKGCDKNPAMKALKVTDSDRHKEVCTKVREDGAFVEAGENDNLLVQKVSTNKGSVGIMGYSFLEQNLDKVRGIAIDDVAPSYDTISTLDYPGARAIYIYVKGEHLAAVPGLREFLVEYAKGWGDRGYLVRRGLIASPPAARAAAEAQVTALKPLAVSDLQ